MSTALGAVYRASLEAVYCAHGTSADDNHGIMRVMTDPTCLWIVATPIGNLGDFSPRAIDILTSVAVIAAEDTRHTARLLAHAGIATPMRSLHEHNEQQRAAQLLELLATG